MRLMYLAYQRLPTTRAHGYQIAKMCSAFAGAGLDVTLVQPRYHNAPQGPPEALVEFYHLPDGLFLQAPVETLVSRCRLNHTSQVIFHSQAIFHANLATIAWQHRRYVAHHAQPGDIVFTRDWRNLGALVKLRDRIGFRLVCELHNLPQRGLPWCVGLLGQADLVILISDAMRSAYLDAGLLAERTMVEHDAFDLAEFTTVPDRSEARRRLGIGDGFVVGFLGSFSHLAGDKGAGQLVEAMAYLMDLPTVSLQLVGCLDPSHEAGPVFARARELGIPPERIGVHGRVGRAEVPIWLSAFDVCTNPLPDNEHNRRASPLKIFEYMAARRPSVVTDLAGTVEVLHHEQNALLVPPGDHEALAAAIRRIHDDPALSQRLANQAREDVEQYTWEKRVGRILARLEAERA